MVNIGNRQKGRLKGKNVIDVGYSKSEIVSGIKQALSPDFRAGLVDLINPYGDGHAADRIVDKLKALKLDGTLLRKRFYEEAAWQEPS